MAKERRTNTSVSAFGGLLDTISAVAKIELKDNPEELAKVDKMVADTKDSNITTAFELQDDAIEAMHQAEEAAEGELTEAEEIAITEQEQAWKAEEQKEQEEEGVGAPDIEE